MPIKIYRAECPDDEVAWLCDNVWEMPAQFEALAAWVRHSDCLPEGRYIADVGFSARADAAGGGCVLESATLARMAAMGIDLWLSEYPPMSDDE